MSLTNFHKAQIILNNINDPILKKLIAKEGDRNGRELEVQIIDGHIIKSQSNLNLRLYWRHLKMGNQGIKDFVPVDASKGIFKVTYPDEMMNAGNVSGFIQIQDGDKIVGTVDVLIVVQGSGFDALAVLASDDYEALNKALIEINRYQTQIDAIKSNLIAQGETLLRNEESKFNSLQSEYESLINGLQNQFNDAMANLTIDSEVITSRTSTTTGKAYTTLGTRLDEMELGNVIENEDTNAKYVSMIKVRNGNPVMELEEI